MLPGRKSYAGFIITPAAEVPAAVQKQTTKTTAAHWYEHAGWRRNDPDKRAGHIITGILSYLIALSAVCMVIIGGAAFFVVSAVPTVGIAALLFAGGFCAGIIALILAHYANNGWGYVGGWFAIIAICIAAAPFLLVYLLGLGLYTLIFRRNAKRLRERWQRHPGFIKRFFYRFKIPAKP